MMLRGENGVRFLQRGKKNRTLHPYGVGSFCESSQVNWTIQNLRHASDRYLDFWEFVPKLDIVPKNDEICNFLGHC
jgi:hypothetical protein